MMDKVAQLEMSRMIGREMIDPVFLLLVCDHLGWAERPAAVFFTREEAEDWAKRRAERWHRWRVYCVAAEGSLAKILARAVPVSVGENRDGR